MEIFVYMLVDEILVLKYLLIFHNTSLHFQEQPTSPNGNSGSMEDVMAIGERESGDNFIEINVEDPQKIGDGMNSYLAYK